MPEQKRKTHTSTAVKRRYNEKVYARVTVDAPKQLVADFKQKCADNGVSVASVMKKAMEEYLKEE